MLDEQIVALYWSRSEQAIAETGEKYGGYLNRIAYGILRSTLDAQECVNDTYHSAWNAMPPSKPNRLSAFLGKITRRLSIDRLRHDTAEKRGGGALPLALDELSECVPAPGRVEHALEERELAETIDRFLRTLPEKDCNLFLRRYWYVDTIAEIARQCGMTDSKVKMQLFRARGRLREVLAKEGIAV